MPFSLRLPYAVCYPLVRLARWIVRPPVQLEQQDQTAYFVHQFDDTVERYRRHMGEMDLHDKIVLDVGGGLGGRALGWLALGASKVINIDINRQELAAGRAIVDERYPQFGGRIDFYHPNEMPALEGDVAILFDSFEHLVNPQEVLRQVNQWLRPGGLVWIGSIGWYNYMASHCLRSYICIPWCQVIFSERAIIKTIRKLLHSPGYVPNVWERMEGLGRWDNVSTLKDRPGEPLNMLSLRRIRRVLKESPFDLQTFRVFPFSGKRHRFAMLAAVMVKLPLLEELMHSYYTAVLIKTFGG